MPGLFVFLWSTGFIGAKLGLPHAPPLTFLALRFTLVAALLVAGALGARAPWPRSAVAGRRPTRRQPALPHAPPLAFLALRFTLVAALLVAVALVARAPWPRSAVEVRHYA